MHGGAQGLLVGALVVGVVGVVVGAVVGALLAVGRLGRCVLLLGGGGAKRAICP
jgi:hypothetical protein